MEFSRCGIVNFRSLNLLGGLDIFGCSSAENHDSTIRKQRGGMSEAADAQRACRSEHPCGWIEYLGSVEREDFAIRGAVIAASAGDQHTPIREQSGRMQPASTFDQALAQNKLIRRWIVDLSISA